jgi:hypothetical protein
MFAKGLTTGAFAVLLAGSQLASAHMEITWPPVYRSKHNPKTPPADIDYNMVAPLDPSGANYPCKGYHTGAEAKESTATFAPGGDYNFTVAGGASHGGGSCQVSLSYDGGNTFKVIQSIIGGCPAGPGSFPFKIPADAPEGNAIWAWTWNNKIGNRELYMNCATVTIGGGGAKRDVEARQSTSFDSRPDILVANVGNGCSVPEGIDVEYPNPGPDVINNGGAIGAPVGCAAGPGAGAGTGTGSGNQGGDAPSSTVQATAAPTAAPSPTDKLPGYVQTSLSSTPVRLTAITPLPNSASISASPSLPSSSGVFITVGSDSSSSAAAAAPTTLVVSTKTPDAVVPQPTTDVPKPVPTGGAGTDAGSGSGSGSANAHGTPCTDEGAWNCINGTSFQRCASGSWSAVQPVAAGTVCKINGNKVLSIEAASSKLRRRFRNSAKLRL